MSFLCSCRLFGAQVVLLVSWGWLLLFASKDLHGCVNADAPCSQHSKDNLQIHEDSASLCPLHARGTSLFCSYWTKRQRHSANIQPPKGWPVECRIYTGNCGRARLWKCLTCSSFHSEILVGPSQKLIFFSPCSPSAHHFVIPLNQGSVTFRGIFILLWSCSFRGLVRALGYLLQSLVFAGGRSCSVSVVSAADRSAHIVSVYQTSYPEAPGNVSQSICPGSGPPQSGPQMYR